MKKILIFLMSLSLYSQISYEYKNAKVLRGTYRQINYYSQNKKTFESSGDFFIASGYGICWFTRKPKESITVMGEKNIYQTFPNGDKKIISDSNNAVFLQIANIIKSIFTYDEKTIRDSFLESKDENGNAVYIPNNSDLQKILNKLEMSVSKDGYIERIKIYNRNGTTEYIMKVLSTENNITDNEKKYFE